MADDASGVAFEARTLMRGARAATLATVADGGQPFASLVTHACGGDFSLLLLLSDLSEHTRHLRAEPRCSLLAFGMGMGENPQTAPRVTITGLAEVADDPVLKARYLGMHPYAALYAGFGDFHLWRVRPLGALFVGGFARAVRVRQADLLPDPAAVAALAAAEAGIIAHCNADHADALAAIAGEPGDWRMVGSDVDGMDLALGERVRRFAWSAPVSDAGEVRTELVRMTREARVGR